jgi:hypothetical protein
VNIIIDVRNDIVRLGRDHILHGQWVEFFALLGLANTDDWITQYQVHQLRLWRLKAPESVGKEVLRKLKTLRTWKVPIETPSRGGGQSWRLRGAKITYRPNKSAVKEWLKHQLTIEPSEKYRQTLRALVELAATSFRGGVLEAQQKRKLATAARGDSNLRAWLAVIDAVALSRSAAGTSSSSWISLQRPWRARYDSIGRAVRYRIAASQAFATRFENPRRSLRRLVKFIREAELRDDVASTAAMLNVAGVLARRAGDPKIAVSHHVRAIELSGLSGDYRTLEAAISNLALAERDILESEGRRPTSETFALIDICGILTDRCGVAADAVQTEIHGARIALQFNLPEIVERYLTDAENRITKIESPFEKGSFYLARAEIHLSQGCGRPENDCDLAEQYFAEVSDLGAMAQARKLRLQCGSRPRKS